MRCASYVRYTSCMPERTTPPDIIRQQNERIQKYIKEHGWELTEKYADRKQDGKADDAFCKMREDGISRKFDMVVVDSLFRCGVNVSYAEDVLLKTFYCAGIHFSVVEDNFCSALLTAAEVEAYFRKKRNVGIAGTLRRQQMEECLNGIFTVHDEKYGYLLSEDRRSLVIDETVVPVIREIFRLLGEENMSYKEVAGILNRRGVESPMKHLTRVGQKSRPDAVSQWTGSSVKRIAENTAYIGYWYKTLAGERIRVENEPIVDRELFDKVAAKYAGQPCRGVPRTPRAENAFIKQIFDKQSGKGLVCRQHRTDEPYQTFSLDFWSKETIRYDDVMAQVVSLLRKERCEAVCALHWILSDEGRKAKEDRKKVLSGQAKALFEDLAALEERYLQAYSEKEQGNVSSKKFERIQKATAAKRLENEAAFQRIMAQTDELELLFSKRNPWIALYGSIGISDRLTKSEVRKWLDRVLIADSKSAEIVLPEKYAVWREMLPADWRCYYGAEKQTDTEGDR